MATGIHNNQVLANMSVLYYNEKAALIGNRVLPTLLVKRSADAFDKYTKADRFTLPDTKLGAKSNANRITWSVTTDTYNCEGHGLEDVIPNEDYQDADDVIDLEFDTLRLLEDVMFLDYEKRVADLAFAAGSYPSGNKVTLSGTDQWSDYENSDPIANIRAAVNGCFRPANKLVMGFEVYNKLIDHPSIVERLRNDALKRSTAMILAELFEVDEVLIGKAKYNTANPGQTASYSYIWGKYCLAAYIEPNPSKRSVTLGATFTQNLPGSANGWLITKRVDPDEPGVAGGTIIKVAHKVDEKIICSDMGYLISGAVA